MKNLFILDGTTGPVKADVVLYLNRQDPREAKSVIKHTTREIRPYENKPNWPLDLETISLDEFERRDYDYSYRYKGAWYGLHRNDIEEALATSDNVFLILRNSPRMEEIRHEFSIANVVSVLMYSDRDGLRQRLQNEGFGESDIQAVMDSNDAVLEGYRMNPDSYDEFVITDCTPENTTRHLDRLISKYRDSTNVKPNLVFVIMSFDPDHVRLPDYYSAMQRVVSKVSDKKWVCKCIKDFSPGGTISGEVKANISACRFVLADMTQNRPNVFYELGYAHAVKKTCIITMEQGTPRQFYPAHYKILEYKNVDDLERQLEAELRMKKEERQI